MIEYLLSPVLPQCVHALPIRYIDARQEPVGWMLPGFKASKWFMLTALPFFHHTM